MVDVPTGDLLEARASDHPPRFEASDSVSPTVAISGIV
jgi:hypothetical protein